MEPDAWTRRDKVVVAGVGVAASIAALFNYFTNSRRPTAPILGNGWWSFSDQGRYLRSTLAWAAGRLDPADHWYLPGYPLLAVPFTRLTHSNPFLLPDLALLTVTVWLAASLTGRLAPQWRLARITGALVALASVLPPMVMDVWVTPWTSSPEAALTLGGLLATLHLTARPLSWRMALAAGACVGAVAGFRPVDAVVLSVIAGSVVGFALLRARPGWPAASRTLGAAIIGAACAIAPTMAAYVAVNGWHLNSYLTLSASIGFEWRLLPLRWVTIILAPEPLFAEGHGLIREFPWVALGFAGMVASLVSPSSRGTRLAHTLIIGTTCVHIALYLCYRDLHSQSLWRSYNYHYFKWALLVLALYTVFLLRALVERRWAAVLAGIVALGLLLPWRAELVRQDGAPTVTAQSGSVLHLPPFALDVQNAIVVPANGSFAAIYDGEHNLYVGVDEEKWYSSTSDFRVTPRPGGLLIAPLRSLRPGPLTMRFGPGVTLASEPAYFARQQIAYGLPCWLPVDLTVCAFPEQPSLPIRPGEVITLVGQNGTMLGIGWSDPEPGGDWTNGPRATLNMKVTPPAAHVLQVTARAFVPPGSAPVEVAVSANDRNVGNWTLSDGDEQVLRILLPPDILGSDGTLRVAFAIANPRRPHDTLSGNADARLLGLFVRSITIEP